MTQKLNRNEIKKYISQRTREIMKECMQRNGIDHRCKSAKELCLEGINNTTDEGSYNYFAVSKITGKIINGWDYNGYDPGELKAYKKDYFTDDLVDYGFDPKKIKILSLRGLKRAGIDPDDDSNWSNGDECLAENKARKSKLKESFDEWNYGNDNEWDEPEDEEFDFYTFIDILEKNGWSYSGSDDVHNKQGQTGVRYNVYPDNKHSTDFDDLVRQLQDAAGSADVIIPGKATYRYAPEIKRLTITVLD